MAGYVTNKDIIEATIRCAWRVGLPAVTMNVIGKEVGILGQGLYNHFDSKDELLASCFNYCDRQLSNLFEGYRLDPNDDLLTSVKKLWFKYFGYFINHPDENSFYRQFRETVDFPHKAERDSSYFRAFWNLVDELDRKYCLYETVHKDIILAYIRNVTPVFARMISDGTLPDTEETREQMWQMISHGFKVMDKK